MHARLKWLWHWAPCRQPHPIMINTTHFVSLLTRLGFVKAGTHPRNLSKSGTWAWPFLWLERATSRRSFTSCRNLSISTNKAFWDFISDDRWATLLASVTTCASSFWKRLLMDLWGTDSGDTCNLDCFESAWSLISYFTISQLCHNKKGILRVNVHGMCLIVAYWGKQYSTSNRAVASYRRKFRGVQVLKMAKHEVHAVFQSSTPSTIKAQPLTFVHTWSEVTTVNLLEVLYARFVTVWVSKWPHSPEGAGVWAAYTVPPLPYPQAAPGAHTFQHLTVQRLKAIQFLLHVSDLIGGCPSCILGCSRGLLDGQRRVVNVERETLFIRVSDTI